MWMPVATAPPRMKGELRQHEDPLELGRIRKICEWYVQCELQHGRWAMLGVAGASAPEILTNIGVTATCALRARARRRQVFPTRTFFWVQMLAMNWAEVRRWQDIKNPGSVSEDPAFGEEV